MDGALMTGRSRQVADPSERLCLDIIRAATVPGGSPSCPSCCCLHSRHTNRVLRVGVSRQSFSFIAQRIEQERVIVAGQLEIGPLVTTEIHEELEAGDTEFPAVPYLLQLVLDTRRNRLV